MINRKLLEALELPTSGGGGHGESIEVIDLNLAVPLTQLDDSRSEVPAPLEPSSVAYMSLGYPN